MSKRINTSRAVYRRAAHGLALFAVLTLATLNSVATAGNSQSSSSSSASGASAGAPPDLEHARLKVEAEPHDARAHYYYGEFLQKAGYTQEAGREFLAATEIDPAFFHAYHQLSLVSSEKHILDQAIARLNFLKEERPNDLLLRVALSELYEKKGEFYPAHKVLVELVYQNAVPEKYLQKINNRIRILQAKVKDTHALDKTHAHHVDEWLESSPPPLPESQLNRDLSISKTKESRTMQGFGHATLLP